MGPDRGEGIFRIRQPIAESGTPDIDILDFPLGLDVAHKSGQQGGERTGKGGRITRNIRFMRPEGHVNGIVSHDDLQSIFMVRMEARGPTLAFIRLIWITAL